MHFLIHTRQCTSENSTVNSAPGQVCLG